MPMPPTIQECKTRLCAFLEGLPKSKIRFRYFTRNMDGPAIAEDMSEWYVGGVQCFIVKGVFGSYPYPYSYTYSLSSIKNVITNGGSGDDFIINTHITIGVTGYRDDPNLWMRTCKTFYRERDVPNTWDRSDIECNFILTDGYKLGKKYESDKLTMDIIEEMNRIYCGELDGGVGPKQAGGKQATPITYKGVGFSGGLVDFLYENVIAKVKLYRDDFESAVILYDERSQLADDANKQIVIMYDFRDDFRVFYIDALKAMTAAYVSKEGAGAVTETERASYQEFLTSVEAPRQAHI